MKEAQNVAIITSKVDPHADAVISELIIRGVPVFRLNTEDLINRYEVSVSIGGLSEININITDELGRSIQFPRDVRTVYHRKPDPVEPHCELNDDGASAFVCREGEEFLRSLTVLPDIRWVNNPQRIRSAQHKIPQLELARRLGLNIPKSLVTMDPDQALRFCEECGWSVICKSLSTTTVTVHGEPRNIYTHAPLRAEIESHIDRVRYGLTFFQQYVPKAFELRITIIGERVFACKIDSQKYEESSIDWRLVDPFTLDHQEVQLPQEVTDALVALLRSSGLSFGAIDMIVTPDGKYVFVENNPNGQWYWIELITGMPMTNAMVELLVGTA